MLIFETLALGDVIIPVIILAGPLQCPSPPQHVEAWSCGHLLHKHIGSCWLNHQFAGELQEGPVVPNYGQQNTSPAAGTSMQMNLSKDLIT